MLKFLVLALFVPVLLSEPTDVDKAVEEFMKHAKVEAEKLWTTMDYNGNGKYDRVDLHTLITDYDNDGDRKVSETEFEFHFDMIEPTLAIVAKAMFSEFDSNEDTFIDEADLNQVYDRMDYMTKDGNVDHQEFVSYYTELITVLYLLQLQHIAGQQ